MKKIYVNSNCITSINIIYVHSDYEANASGAKMARDDGCNESNTLIQVGRDCVYIIDPRVRARSQTKPAKEKG